MASRSNKFQTTAFEAEDFAFEERVSLYMLLEDSQRAVKKKYLLHRLIFIAYISPELADKRDLGAHYEQLYQKLQQFYQGDGVTGLLLIYPSYVVHTIESSSDVLFSVLRDLRNMEEHRTLIVDPKILVMSHDIPNRLFQQWSYKVLKLPARTLVDKSHREPTEKLVSESLTLLLRLGTYLLRTPKSSKTPPDSILDKVPELIIPQDTIGDLLEREELLSSQKYLETYDSPLNIVMDSERVWPPSEHLGLI
ncbi:testis-expressed protein 47-like isoform X1 [Lepisosteus oculatus]|uniref:testis-expressed protein 47-like isoform X1 n=1 Tax=Lepisosteus oculatus TaxID=7918 RepID=UPI003724A636